MTFTGALFLLILVAAHFHLFLFVYNRWLITLPESRAKVPLHWLALVLLFLLPTLVLLLFHSREPVAPALALAPEGPLSTAVFLLVSAVVLLWAVRSVLWVADRFFPDRPPQLVEETVSPAHVPPVFSFLPRPFRALDTTGDLELIRREVTVSGLAPAFDGLTIAHVSDLHFGQRIEMVNYLEGVVDLIRKLDADIVVLTGDFVDERRHIAHSVEYHARFRGRLGTFCVLGNHDYWTRPEAILHEIARTHIRWLGGGERRALKKCDRRLIFAGTDAPWDGIEPDWRRLLRRGPADAAILLSHTPDNAPTAARHGASLVLSGHNHGGQIRLPGFGAVVVPSLHGVRFAGGVYRAGPDTVLNVSKGVGVSAPPVRLLCPPDICLLTLRVPVVDVMAGRVIDARKLVQRQEEAPSGQILVNRQF